MTGQIIEITKSGYSLRKKYGFLEVSSKDEIVGSVPLDDIAAVIIARPGSMVSTVLIDQLSKRNIPLIISGDDFLPTSIAFPVQGYGRQFGVMKAQMGISQPRRKRAWQKIVRSKIYNQAMVLQQVGAESKQLERLSARVKSGDPENYEAQAARVYWRRLFGASFRRDRNSAGLNSALNYTYTIIRSCVARGISSAGLHPSFSVHHINPQNPLNLVDDLVEPYRPIADYFIWQHCERNFDELTSHHKQTLAKILNLQTTLNYKSQFNEESPLSRAVVKMCKSFANYCEKKDEEFLLPNIPSPLTIQNI